MGTNGHDIVTIGASAGGVDALSRLAGGLPKDLAAALFVVVHISSTTVSMLPAILSRSGPLEALHPQDGDKIQKGKIYIAPPDYHLLLDPGRVRLVRGPLENHTRPAIDPLFRTAAVAYRSRVIGVVLSGTLDDGTAGLLDIKKCGGLAVVQDPADALYPCMPRSALECVSVDHCVPIAGMADLLAGLVGEPSGSNPPIPSMLSLEAEMAKQETKQIDPKKMMGHLSSLSCPDCGGPLWEIKDQDPLRFRCLVGHGYTASHLLEAHGDALEESLWTAIRIFEGQARLYRRLTRGTYRQQRTVMAKYYEKRARDAEQNAHNLQEIANKGQESHPFSQTP